MRKTAVILFLFFAILGINISEAKADTVILSNGDTINGKIEYILRDLVEIKTKDGVKRVNRDVSNSKARDVIEVGFIKKKKLSGEVFFLDSDLLEISVPSGRMNIKRFWIRNIVLSGQTQYVEKSE